MRLRSGVVLVVAALILGLVEAGAGAQAKPRPRPAATGLCGSPPCYTAFTVNGGPPPGTVSLTVTNIGGNQLQIQLANSGNIDLSGAIGTNDAIHLVLDIGSFDPVVFGTTGFVTGFSESIDNVDNTLTLDMKPSASSWSMAGCTVISCGSDVSPVTATNDFGSVVLGFVSNMNTATQAVRDAMRGTWFSTNAQSMTLPTFSATTGAASFTVAAPHFKTDGATLNTGFFEFYAPDALVEAMGVVDPGTVTNGSFTVTSSNATSTVFGVTHEASPPGVLIQAGTNLLNLPPFNYSSPTFTVAKSNAPARTLTVTRAGAGSGNVSSSPDGIACGSTCSHAFDDGTAVTLTAGAAVGSSFTGWSGACSGAGQCHLTMDASKSVTATFTATPTIASFSPGSAAVHGTVTVNGTNFDTTTQVRVGGVSAPFAVVSATRLTFTVPAGAADGPIAVVNPAGTATSVTNLDVLPPPAITSFGPGSGPIGTAVTITGTNLGGTVGVLVGSVVTVPTSVSATQVVFAVPPGAVTGHIVLLTTSGAATSAGTFTVTP